MYIHVYYNSLKAGKYLTMNLYSKVQSELIILLHPFLIIHKFKSQRVKVTSCFLESALSGVIADIVASGSYECVLCVFSLYLQLVWAMYKLISSQSKADSTYLS